MVSAVEISHSIQVILNSQKEEYTTCAASDMINALKHAAKTKRDERYARIFLLLRDERIIQDNQSILVEIAQEHNLIGCLKVLTRK